MKLRRTLGDSIVVELEPGDLDSLLAGERLHMTAECSAILVFVLPPKTESPVTITTEREPT
jgi:hypothetical protein